MDSELGDVNLRMRLIAAAKAAGQKAYAPYSGFPVGAALLGEDGRIYTGCNVENASYGLGLCAERAAVAAMVGAGVRRFTAAAVFAPAARRPVSPCGACRQVMVEFSRPDAAVFMAGPDGEAEESTVGELMPRGFGGEDLVRP